MSSVTAGGIVLRPKFLIWVKIASIAVTSSAVGLNALMFSTAPLDFAVCNAFANSKGSEHKRHSFWQYCCISSSIVLMAVLSALALASMADL